MLDALGNEIVEEDDKGLPGEQVQAEAVDFDSTHVQNIETRNLERKEALELLHKAITELRDDFNRTDDLLYVTIMRFQRLLSESAHRSPRAADAVDAQIADLKSRSIRAMEERQRLLSKIQVLEAGDLRSLAADAASFRHGASASIQIASRHVLDRSLTHSCSLASRITNGSGVFSCYRPSYSFSFIGAPISILNFNIWTNSHVPSAG